MKKIILISALIFSVFTCAQTPKVNVVKYKQTTTAQRDAFVVPAGEFWKIYNTTNSRYEYWDGDSWERSLFVPSNLLTDYSFTDNSANWNTAFGWGNWSSGVTTVFVDALGIDAATLGTVPASTFIRKDQGATKSEGTLTFADDVKIGLGTKIGSHPAEFYYNSTTQNVELKLITASKFSIITAGGNGLTVDNATDEVELIGNLKMAATKTVDGRDVSVDGAKLDAVVTGAHFSPGTLLGDYSFTDNSANWNTAFGWGNWSTGVTKAFVDALGIDSATLGGVSPSSILRSDISDTKTLGDLSFSSGVAAFFNGKTRIFATGTNTLIDVLSGDLKIGDNGVVRYNFGRTTGIFELNPVTSATGLLVKNLTTGLASVFVESNRSTGNLGQFASKQTGDAFPTTELNLTHLGTYDFRSGDGTGAPVTVATLDSSGNLDVTGQIESTKGLINTGTGNNLNIASNPNGSIEFGNNAGSNINPNIVGKSNDNTGLTLIGATNDANTASDMLFNVRENDNTDFATLTSKAFRWSRFSTELMSLTRDGNLDILNNLNINGTFTSEGTGSVKTILKRGTGSTSIGMSSNINNIFWDLGSTGAVDMLFNSTGLGIGTSAPAVKLHVKNAGGSGVIRAESSAGNTLDFTASSTGASFIQASASSALNFGHVGAVSQIVIATGGDVSMTDNLAVTGTIQGLKRVENNTVSFTLDIADISDILIMDTTSATAVTIPLNSVVAFPIGTVITIMNIASGNFTIANIGGVTVINSTGCACLVYGESRTLTKIKIDTWIVNL